MTSPAIAKQIGDLSSTVVEADGTADLEEYLRRWSVRAKRMSTMSRPPRFNPTQKRGPNSGV